MKKPLHIIKTWFETGDIPTQQQFWDTYDSFYHKDDGDVITSKSVNEAGDVTFKFSDDSKIVIKKFIPDTNKPLKYIEGLVDRLTNIDKLIQNLQGNKVDKVDGKKLTDANFTEAEKEKLKGLKNYTPPVSKPINFIIGLQDLLNQINQKLSTKVNKIDGKDLSTNDFTDVLKEKLENLDDLKIYNLSNTPSFLNFNYFGKDVFGVLLKIPEINEDTYVFNHNLKVQKYLRLEVWENGLPFENPKMKARQDLTELIYKDVLGIGGSSINATPIGIKQTGNLKLTEDEIKITSSYVFPSNKLLYLEYTKLTEGIGIAAIGNSVIGNSN